MPLGTAVSQVLDVSRSGSRADELRAELRHLVVGQDEAVAQVVETYQMIASGLSAPGRPRASFLLLGPTGTGKTRLVESLAKILHGSTAKVLKIDCAEFQHSHEIAKLVGSPPGYLGHRETHAILDQSRVDATQSEGVPISLVLFDEIEKASDSVWNLLLGILDKATLTLGDNRKVDFTQCVIFLTSNLGSKDIARLSQPNLGFAPTSGTAEDIEKLGAAAARAKFTPEFMNRIDSTVVFHPLSEAHLREILELELTQLQHRIMGAIVSQQIRVRFMINLRKSAKDLLLRSGNDPRYGARFLKRTLERLVMHPVVNLLTSEQIQDGDVVWVEEVDGALSFSREGE